MMKKWGKQKASFNTTPTSHPSLISHVFPLSWLSKFNQSRKNGSEHTLARSKKKGQLGTPSPISSPGIRAREGRFYARDDDDSYWRLSFGDEQLEKLATCQEVPVSCSRSSSSENTRMSGREKSSKTYDMVCNLGQTRIMQSKGVLPLESSALRRKKVKEGEESKRGRRNFVKVQDFEKLGPREVHEEEEITTTKAAENAIFEVQPERRIRPGDDFCQTVSNSQKQCSFYFQNSKLRTTEGGHTLEVVNLEETHESEGEEEVSLQGKVLKDVKITETNSKNEQQRKSIYINRGCRRKRRKLAGRIKSYSPRSAARIDCKIKALEDMKKVNMMKRRKSEGEPADATEKRAEKNATKQKAQGDTTTFDSYAVVKNSLNPKQDFRESMIEMIFEKGIEKPEELEELLACYLTLNYDEHHDLIVKVFREVWLELNELCLVSESQNDCFDDY